jgi:hypothetical protein
MFASIKKKTRVKWILYTKTSEEIQLYNEYKKKLKKEKEKEKKKENPCCRNGWICSECDIFAYFFILKNHFKKNIGLFLQVYHFIKEKTKDKRHPYLIPCFICNYSSTKNKYVGIRHHLDGRKLFGFYKGFIKK